MKNIFTIALLLLTLNSCYVGRAFVYNFSGINDYKKFPSRELTASTNPYSFQEPNDTTLFKHVLTRTGYDTYNNFEKMLDKSNTVGFLVIQNDSIKYEWYSKKNDAASMFTSFSMSKSYVSALIGIAIEEGFIKSVDEPITNYIKTFKHDGFDSITIAHLLNMRSGIKYIENYYNPFGNVAIAYYGKNLQNHISKLKIEEKPDQNFHYISIAPQILGVILEKVTGKSVTEYCQEKLWTPLGMEYDASWSLDKKDGTEKAFCCLNARARDYAKFGVLYLNKGKWRNEQIIPEEWIHNSVEIHADTKTNFYQYQWWLEPKMGESKSAVNYMAQGHLGQYIYVSPDKNTVIVRLGKNRGGVNWRSVFNQITSSI